MSRSKKVEKMPMHEVSEGIIDALEKASGFMGMFITNIHVNFERQDGRITKIESVTMEVEL
jgi:hypothetical protein